MRRIFVLLLLPIAARGPSPVVAQSLDVGDVYEDYLRALQISGDADLGSFTVRPLVFREDASPLNGSDHPWAASLLLPPHGSSVSWQLDPIDARLRVFENTRAPTAQNDGMVWQGRGITTAIDIGSTLRWRDLRITVKPTLTYAQNLYFDLAPVSVADQPSYAYPWRKIDLPQRFGPDALWTIGPGQSEIRVSGKGVTGGLSSRNLWWGPGVRSAIIMSNNAAGIPHAFLGTRGPRNIGIGTVEANWIWGRLGQSDWFDPSIENDERFISGLVVAYNPSVLPGLSLGLTRVFYGSRPPEGLSLSDHFIVFQGVTKASQVDPSSPTGDDDKDQLLSVFGRWVLAESGFEVYGEWARNDHSGDLTDFALEPEHSQGYTLGLQKALELKADRRLTLKTELTHLEREATFRLRASPVYYSHYIVTQGYTHEGQIVGAGVGPGGIQQFFGADLFAPWGRAGLVLQRRVHDNDAYYEWAAENGAGFDNHDVSLDIGADAIFLVDDFEVGGGAIFTRQLNRYFDGPNVTNLHLNLTARWRRH